LVVESSDHLKVNADISKYDIGKIETGQKADIIIAGNTYTGTVTEIKRLAVTDASDKATVTVSIHIDNPDEKVFLGIEAEVNIYTEEKEDSLVISKEALYSDDAGDYCYAIVDGVIVRQDITVGISSDSLVEVLDGLNEGAVVITDAVTDEQIGRKAVAQ